MKGPARFALDNCIKDTQFAFHDLRVARGRVRLRKKPLNTENETLNGAFNLELPSIDCSCSFAQYFGLTPIAPNRPHFIFCLLTFSVTIRLATDRIHEIQQKKGFR